MLSCKILKFNFKGKKQERILLMTNKFLYNVLPLNMIISVLATLKTSSKIKRKISIEKIAFITISKPGVEFVIHVPDEYDYRFSSDKL